MGRRLPHEAAARRRRAGVGRAPAGVGADGPRGARRRAAAGAADVARSGFRAVRRDHRQGPAAGLVPAALAPLRDGSRGRAALRHDAAPSRGGDRQQEPLVRAVAGRPRARRRLDQLHAADGARDARPAARVRPLRGPARGLAEGDRPRRRAARPRRDPRRARRRHARRARVRGQGPQPVALRLGGGGAPAEPARSRSTRCGRSSPGSAPPTRRRRARPTTSSSRCAAPTSSSTPTPRRSRSRRSSLRRGHACRPCAGRRLPACASRGGCPCATATACRSSGACGWRAC